MNEKNANTTKEEIFEKEEKQSARTFSQEEVNAIVQKRLAEEKSRNSEHEKAQTAADERERQLEEREKALEISERKFKAKTEFEKSAIPEGFLDFLDYSSDDEMMNSIKKLTELLKGIGFDQSKNNNISRVNVGGSDHHSSRLTENDPFTKGIKGI